MGCPIENVAHLDYLYEAFGDSTFSKILFGIFIVDGCLCVTFAFLTHLRYSSVTVLNYAVNTNAISNTRWIWFFIFTAISLFINGIHIWINLKENKYSATTFIIGWIAHQLALMMLAFAINYQWKCREGAFHNMSSRAESETTPMLEQQVETSKNVSLGALCLAGLIVISCGFFIAAYSTKSATFYWLAFGFAWFVRIVIIVMVFAIHYKLSLDGSTIIIKCVLLAGVLLNTFSDIPTYLWLKCIFLKTSENMSKDCFYVVALVMVLSHALLFGVVRAEYRRLKDITRWHVANQIDHFSISSTHQT